MIFAIDHKLLSKCNVYIVTVPTPINSDKSPDLNAITSASKIVASAILP